MLVLAVDTSTPAVTAGVVQLDPQRWEPTELARRVTVNARAHAEVLTPSIAECLESAGLGFADLDAVVVGTGPGPFTGLRVGMVTGAALADALGIPAHGVCSLDAIAAQCQPSILTAEGQPSILTAEGQPSALPAAGETGAEELLVVTDARRREIYWARYRGGERIDGPAVSKPADVRLDGATHVAGSPAHAALFDAPVLGVASPTPIGLVAASATLRAGTAPGPLVPLYLRRPDATEPSAMKNPPGTWRYGA
ncbi:tRNA (adenosine(37)-N6)-threonylcarbamoyltransferase complex dimerization subunit type 1 TsaB [Lolliginicoccus levis]|uniref:tRNA (adenosine(37)-N6)-threonylcarbamoyltransferase complex dimerization subunit type 1 TsaB n=1 Tax=Lolliginicoccus levis TaxID=2919542 RepID=UPI00241D24E3|nr:tRNA (adenosine(37)-N6)-threonylcarbamoyltransferase complex dimerization subunit type 1 TsaB [Lolliginicoccus levis]